MIQMVGTDHRLAPVEIRSVFSLCKEEQIALMQMLRQKLHADGVVALLTCNRMEIWISTATDEPEDLIGTLCRFVQVDQETFRPYMRERIDDAAVKHLFYLTCGLRSAILAEDQILTQVKNALVFSRANGMTDGCLEVLFRMAVTAAKKVKTEVTFTRSDATAIAQAVSILEKEGFLLSGKKCMVIGNGEYGRLAATTLREKGADVTVTVRQYHSGMVSIPKGCRQIPYGERFSLLETCDLVVSATTSPHYTVKRSDVENLAPEKNPIFVDLAVPRDIDPAISALNRFRVFDIDDFGTQANSANDGAYAEADKILHDAMREFWDWMNGRDLIPHIQRIEYDAAHDFYLRIRKIINKLPMEDNERQKLFAELESAAMRTTAKMIFDLQDHVSEEEFRDCVRGLEKVYDETE